MQQFVVEPWLSANQMMKTPIREEIRRLRASSLAHNAGWILVGSTRLARRAALLGIFMAAAMFVCAPLISHIVGNGFGESAMALRWLCLIPAFCGIHQLTGSAITGKGFQRYRTAAQFSAAALNFGLNLWLTPRFGWRGAAWSNRATDGSLGLANWLISRRLPLWTAARRWNANAK